MTPLFRSVALAATIGYAAASFAATFTVTNTNDSGAGSLRQAILDSYRDPGPNVIEFAIDGAPPYVIEVHGQFLPPLKGPLVLRMKRTAAEPPSTARRLPSPVVVLDGSALVQPRTPSACPGATFSYNSQTGQWEASDVRGSGANVRGYYGAGLAVQDSHDVEISGIEIRNFCAGVATVRSSNVYIHDVKIVDSHGAAGVIFTGDDGKSGRTDLSFNNRLVNSLLLDNGDGFEFTRGTHDSFLQGNTITLTQPLPEDGNAIEFAQSGDNNAVIGNTFSKYVDTAVTINGNHHTIRDNKFIDNKGDGLRANGAGLLIEGNTFADNGGAAMTVGGEGTRVLDNVVSGNGAGIIVSSAGVEISRNSIHNNAKPGIDVAAAPAGVPPRSPSRNVSEIPDSPVLSGASSWSTEGLTLNGSLAGKPGQVYRVEIFASRPADGAPAVQSSGEKYLGSASAKTDSNGKADFSLSLRLDDPLDNGKTVAVFTATATDSSGSTSKFSRALSLTKSATASKAPGEMF